MRKGILFWITGLSGAGKTTIGNELYYRLREKEPTIILDGDILKNISSKDLGYEESARLERAYRYSNLCKMITDQGINVVICTIAMFDEIRDWNRAHIERYIEVFLDVPMGELKERNRKGLYSRGNQNVVGVDVGVQFPKTPNVVIRNTKKTSVKQHVDTILNYSAETMRAEDYEVDYWDHYYRNQNNVQPPSLFAQDMLARYMKPGKRLIEFGCGDGRDSLFFANNHVIVTGIDQSHETINNLLNKSIPDCCTFYCDDFINAEAVYQTQYDYCYSRFTLHAISREGEGIILRKAFDMLKEGGYLMIEARSIHDGKYGLGKKVGHNSFEYDGHYRRFIVPDEIKKSLKNIGFKIEECRESDQFAPKDGEKCICVRIVGKK